MASLGLGGALARSLTGSRLWPKRYLNATRAGLPSGSPDHAEASKPNIATLQFPEKPIGETLPRGHHFRLGPRG